MKHYRLGWLPDVPDQRDIPFAAVYRLPRRLPPRVDLCAGCSPVENQGALGSCTAQALVGNLEFIEQRALERAGVPPGARFRDLSRLFVYFNERAALGTTAEDSGAMLRTGIKTLKKLGVCREALWPYQIRRFRDRPAPACFTEARQHQVTAYQRLGSLAEMKACLAMGLPFVFGFSVYAHVMTAAVARTGRLRLPQPDERLVGGHAVLAVGYDDRAGVMLFRNSWGVRWGRRGYGTLPYAYFENRNLADDFWCIQATERDLYARWRRPGSRATAVC